MNTKRLVIIGIIFLLAGITIGVASTIGDCSSHVSTLPPLAFNNDGGVDGGAP
jgi:hypothetical protein